MPDYSKGKIYKIYPISNHDEGDIYIGSTTRPLSERMSGHRSDFKKNNTCCSKILFEKYGLENCKIELIENFSCLNIEELNKKEGEHQRLQKCINLRISGRTDKEYRNDNKQKLQEQKKIYYQENQELFLNKSKEYALENKEKIKQYKKEYALKNKEKLRQYHKDYKLRTKE